MMKKIFLVIFLLLLSITAWGGDWFGMEYALTAAYGYGLFMEYEFDPTVFYEPETDKYYTTYQTKFWEFGTFFVEMDTTVWLWELLYFGGAITVQMLLDDFTGIKPSFRPTATNYNFEMGLYYKGVSLFFKHDCTHPQNPHPFLWRVTSASGEGATYRIGVMFEGKTGAVND
jgi:hypothetical protein